MFIESHEKRRGVVLIKLEDWRNYTILRSRVKPRNKYVMLRLLNKKYDYKLFLQLLKIKVFKKILKNNNEDKLICSELIDYAYYYTIGNGNVCTPKTIYDEYRRGNLIKLK